MPYTRTFKLKDNEIPAKINLETGEIKEVRNTFPKTPEDFERWLEKDKFIKRFTIIDNYLKKVLKPDEYWIVSIMSDMADPVNNSLAPLDDDTSLRDLSGCFKINKDKIGKILDKLFILGVFARFDVYKPEKPYTKYWILNPYISCKRKYMSTEIASLFEGTTIEMEYRKEVRIRNN